MKKHLTTYHYYDFKKKEKYDPEKFDKQLDRFKEWEKKKNEKIKNRKMEQQKKEYDDYTSKNIHYKKDLYNVDTSDVISRLYEKDLKKRREEHKTLIKVYEPPFRPNVYKENYIRYGHIKSTIDNRNKNVVKKKIRIARSTGRRNVNNLNYYNSNYNDEDEDEEEDNQEEEHDEEDIQNRFRQMLFFNKRRTQTSAPKRKNNSAKPRKKVRRKA